MTKLKYIVIGILFTSIVVLSGACAIKENSVEKSSSSNQSTVASDEKSSVTSTTTQIEQSTESTSNHITNTSESINTTSETSVLDKNELDSPEIYSELADDLNLEKLLKDSGQEEQYQLLLQALESYDLSSTNGHDPFRNEFVRSSLDSEDAKKLSNNLDEVAEKYNELRSENADKIKNGETKFSWSSMTLENVVNTDETIGFITCKTNWVVPGPGFVVCEAYNFEKADGNLIEDSAVLEKAGLNYEKLNELLAQTLSSQLINRGGESLKPEVVNSIEEARNKFSTNDDDMIFIRVKPENGVLLDNGKIIAIVESYSAMEDEFVFQKIQEIGLSNP